MTTAESNAQRVRRIYAGWIATRGRNVDEWLEIASDDFRIVSGADEYAVAKFGAGPRGKEGLCRYLENITRHWAMEHFEIVRMVDAGDEVVAVSNIAFRNRTTGKVASGAMVDVWAFRDGKAVSFLEVFDTASMVAAATPDTARAGTAEAA